MKFAAILLVTVLLSASDLLLAAESADISALRALDQSYATKWIEGDADGVMALFTEDATLVPLIISSFIPPFVDESSRPNDRLLSDGY